MYNIRRVKFVKELTMSL